MVNYRKLYRLLNFRFDCNSCEGLCCKKAGAVVLFPGEADHIASLLPQLSKHITAEIIEGEKIDLLNQPCPFLENRRCTLRDMRPLDCRIYPFDWCVNNGKIEIFFARNCQAIKIDEDIKNAIEKTIRNALMGFSNKWLKAASLFGPCGLCEKRTTENCELWPPKGFNMQEW